MVRCFTVYSLDLKADLNLLNKAMNSWKGGLRQEKSEHRGRGGNSCVVGCVNNGYSIVFVNSNMTQIING